MKDFLLVTGIHNLAQAEAVERARLLDVTSYDIALDLTDGSGNPGAGTFGCVTTVRFLSREPGASTFIEAAATAMRRAVLNGVELDLGDWNAEDGLRLPNLAADNTLVVEASFPYSSSGQGLHRAVDPADKEVYLYADRDIPYGIVVEVMAAAQRAGIGNVGMITDPSAAPRKSKKKEARR